MYGNRASVVFNLVVGVVVGRACCSVAAALCGPCQAHLCLLNKTTSNRGAGNVYVCVCAKAKR